MKKHVVVGWEAAAHVAERSVPWLRKRVRKNKLKMTKQDERVTFEQRDLVALRPARPSGGTAASALPGPAAVPLITSGTIAVEAVAPEGSAVPGGAAATPPDPAPEAQPLPVAASPAGPAGATEPAQVSPSEVDPAPPELDPESNLVARLGDAETTIRDLQAALMALSERVDRDSKALNTWVTPRWAHDTLWQRISVVENALVARRILVRSG